MYHLLQVDIIGFRQIQYSLGLYALLGKIAESEILTPSPERRELPNDWQKWTICTKRSEMLIKFTEKLTFYFKTTSHNGKHWKEVQR